jgi:tetratricopeptide (TPR) repeat protein
VKLAKLQGKADAQPPGGVTKRDLAWFYFLRAHGRDQLGRLKDAIADIEKGLEVAQVGVEPLLAGRLRQLAIRLYLTAGSPKKALSVNLAQIQIHNQPGSGNGMGYLFEAYLEMTRSYILTGDLAQAETYLRRNEALIITGRTSGIPCGVKATSISDTHGNLTSTQTVPSF